MLQIETERAAFAKGTTNGHQRAAAKFLSPLAERCYNLVVVAMLIAGGAAQSIGINWIIGIIGHLIAARHITTTGRCRLSPLQLVLAAEATEASEAGGDSHEIKRKGACILGCIWIYICKMLLISPLINKRAIGGY